MKSLKKPLLVIIGLGMMLTGATANDWFGAAVGFLIVLLAIDF